ncbi:MAG: HAD family hydrolase [Ktedonobacterales bacterium]|nr:HAD family hydrolase [Ktedonobacterales bacterium]
MLFLFDIDGTLLRRMPPAHRQAVCDGARAVYGVELTPPDLGQTAGMTDSAIAWRLLTERGVPAETITRGLPAFFVAAAEAYERHVPADLRPYQIAHVTEALAWLRERGAALGLVTGNIQRIAWTKLGAAGLAEWFGCGAFGDEAAAREELPPRAVARARAVFGRDFAPERVYIIGDTPADIACGAAGRYRTVGVATGSEHSLEHLRACDPDYLFEDMRGIRTIPL